MKLLLALVTLCLSSSLVGAAEPIAPEAGGSPIAGWNRAQAERTWVLGLKANIQRGESAFAICEGCHRAGALGRVDGSYPRLAGQHATVLIKQITDVRSGLRSNPKMLPFADQHALTPQEIADVAAYLEGLAVPPGQGTGSGRDLERASLLYRKDCESCHGPVGQGDAQAFYPRIAGQHFGYLLRASKMIRDGVRRNAHPQMVELIQNYSDDDLSLVSDLVSRMPSAPR
ncbi:MAG: c-type cytochrome [Rhodoferax sp.]|nr:c-type cytochrome [Rhodoferax sp.]